MFNNLILFPFEFFNGQKMYIYHFALTDYIIRYI